MTVKSAVHTGQRVRLRIDTSTGGFGLVTHVDSAGFSVTYEATARAKGEPHTRHTYPWSKVDKFEVGPFGEVS